MRNFLGLSVLVLIALTASPASADEDESKNESSYAAPDMFGFMFKVGVQSQQLHENKGLSGFNFGMTLCATFFPTPYLGIGVKNDTHIFVGHDVKPAGFSVLMRPTLPFKGGHAVSLHMEYGPLEDYNVLVLGASADGLGSDGVLGFGFMLSYIRWMGFGKDPVANGIVAGFTGTFGTGWIKY